MVPFQSKEKNDNRSGCGHGWAHIQIAQRSSSLSYKNYHRCTVAHTTAAAVHANLPSALPTLTSLDGRNAASPPSSSEPTDRDRVCSKAAVWLQHVAVVVLAHVMVTPNIISLDAA